MCRRAFAKAEFRVWGSGPRGSMSSFRDITFRGWQSQTSDQKVPSLLSGPNLMGSPTTPLTPLGSPRFPPPPPLRPFRDNQV